MIWRWPFIRLSHCAVSVVINLSIFTGVHAMNAEQLAGVVPMNPEFPLGDVRRYGATPIETEPSVPREPGSSPDKSGTEP